MLRRVALGLVIVGAVAGAIWFGTSKPDQPKPPSEQPQVHAPRLVLTPKPPPVGKKTLRGSVTFNRAPVEGVTVHAVFADPTSVVSGQMCPAHPAVHLTKCECGVAADTLAELVSARQGEAIPIATTTSDVSGHFAFDSLPDAALTLWAERGEQIGFIEGVMPREVPVDLDLNNGEFIVGRAVHDDGSAAIEAHVTALETSPGRLLDATVSSDGQFRIGPLLEPNVRVVATADGLLSVSASATPEAPVVLRLSRALAVRGLVVARGAPVDGAIITVDGLASTTSDSRGEFLLERLHPGQHALEALGTAGRGFALIRVARSTSVQLELLRGRDMTGFVVDDRGVPVEGAIVTYQGPSIHGEARTDASGAFTVPSALEGTPLFLTAMKEGFAQARVRVASTSKPRLRLEPLSVLAGSVVDASGAPVNVFTATVGADQRTFSDGKFRFVLSPGTLSLGITAPHFSSQEVPLEKPAEGVVVRLSRGGQLEGLVRSSSNTPIANAAVLVASDQFSDEATTDSTGRFVLEALHPGSYQVQVEAADPEQGILPVGQIAEVRDGSVTRVTLTLNSSGEVAGTVVDANGQQLEHVVISGVGDVSHDELRASTDEQGAFRLIGFGAQKVSLSAKRDDEERVVTVTSPARDVRIVFPVRPVMNGRVLGDDGSGLAEFDIGTQHVFAATNGRFSIELRAPAQKIVVSAPGYAPTTVAVTGQTSSLGDVRLSRGKTLEVRVSNARTNEPFGDAFIVTTADGVTRVESTDSSGRLVIEHLSSRPTLQIIPRGFDGKVLTNVEGTFADVKFEPGATLLVSTLDPKGQLVPGSLRLQGANDRTVNVTPISDVPLAIRGLKSGETSVSFVASGQRSARATVMLVEGSTTQLELMPSQR